MLLFIVYVYLYLTGICFATYWQLFGFLGMLVTSVVGAITLFRLCGLPSGSIAHGVGGQHAGSSLHLYPDDGG